MNETSTLITTITITTTIIYNELEELSEELALGCEEKTEFIFSSGLSQHHLPVL